MELLLQQLANGLVIGSTYAVVAIGFALAFTVLRVINFAHPDIFMVGMFAGLLPATQWPALGFGIALLAGFIVKNLTDDFLFRSNAKEFWALSALLLGYGVRRELRLGLSQPREQVLAVA